MMLVVDCNLKEVTLTAFKEKRTGPSVVSVAMAVDEARAEGVLARRVRAMAGKDKIEAIAFRVLFGGDRFDRATPVDAAFFARFKELTDLFPFYVPTMLELLRVFRKVFTGVRLVAFFETSFFLRLPDEEKYYALPAEFHRDHSIAKWGFHGIFHEANAGLVPGNARVISIVFDKQTTVCAVRDKQPLSVSLGYTPLEGIMSRTSCGDLDPGIVFYLMNVHGFSIYKIDEMLKRESGFLGLTGYDVGMQELLKMRGRDARVDLAFAVYRAQIMRHIGEGLAIMGGLDAIVFAGESVDRCMPVIHDLLKSMAFLGINTIGLPWTKIKEAGDISSDTSRVRVCVNRMDLAKVIFYQTRQYLR